MIIFSLTRVTISYPLRFDPCSCTMVDNIFIAPGSQPEVGLHLDPLIPFTVPILYNNLCLVIGVHNQASLSPLTVFCMSRTAISASNHRTVIVRPKTAPILLVKLSVR